MWNWISQNHIIKGPCYSIWGVYFGVGFFDIKRYILVSSDLQWFPKRIACPAIILKFRRKIQIEIRMIFFPSILKIIWISNDFTTEMPGNCSVRTKITSLRVMSTKLLLMTTSCHSSLSRENNLMPCHTFHFFIFFFSSEKCTDFKTNKNTPNPQQWSSSFTC